MYDLILDLVDRVILTIILIYLLWKNVAILSTE